jgi:hypothetical protein
LSFEAKIIGFGRASDRIEVEVDIPATALRTVMAIAEVPAGDPDLVGTYPLDERQTAMIADAVEVTVDPRKFTYFLEAYDA